MVRRPQRSTLFPSRPLSRSLHERLAATRTGTRLSLRELLAIMRPVAEALEDRKSTRLNSSHANISYAVFCLKKKINTPSHLSHLSDPPPVTLLLLALLSSLL